MSDTIDDYRAIKADRKAERRKLLDVNLQKLFDAGIAYTSNNLGGHCQAEFGGRQFDIWPSTGRWKVRGSSRSYLGIDSFIKHYNVMRAERDAKYVQAMERAYPHLKGETA